MSAAVLLFAGVHRNASAQAQPPYQTRAAQFVRSVGTEAKPDGIGRIVDMATSSGGRLYVLDGADFNVKLFDTSGTFVRAFGRRGGGPGEFQSPWRLVVDDSSVLVSDRGNRTATTFSLDGKFIRSGPLESLARETHQLRHGMELKAEVVGGPTSPMMATVAERGAAPMRVITLRRASGTVDTLLKYRRDQALFEFYGGRGGMQESGFGDAGTWAVAGDSAFVIVDGYAGTVKRYRVGVSGPELLRTDAMKLDVVAVTRADISASESRIAARSTPMGGQPPGTPANRLWDPPTRWSVATQSFLLTDGTVWVAAPGAQVIRQADGKLGTTVTNNVWTVFPNAGSPYRVRLPATVFLREVRGRLLYCLPLSGGEEPAIHLYRVGN